MKWKRSTNWMFPSWWTSGRGRPGARRIDTPETLKRLRLGYHRGLVMKPAAAIACVAFACLGFAVAGGCRPRTISAGDPSREGALAEHAPAASGATHAFSAPSAETM